MAKNSEIEWTDHTWSPWEGCQKTGSLACEHCYAEARNARFGGGIAPNWGPHAERRPTAEASWRKALAWDRAAAARGKPERVFPSLCDPFDNKAPVGVRVRFGKLIVATPNLIWLLLTKRIGNAATMLAEMFPDGVPPNVWLGATVVTQEEADRDVPKLLAIAGPRVRFLSMEPLLGPVDLTRCRVGTGTGEGEWAGKTIHLNIDALRGARSIKLPALDWVIVGGESGLGARPMHPDWARGLRTQCVKAGVPFLFKQWGSCLPGDFDGEDENGNPAYEIDDCAGPPDYDDLGRGRFVPAIDGQPYIRFAHKRTGRMLDGRTHDGFPE